MPQSRLITVELQFPPRMDAFHARMVLVKIVDISLADAPSILIAQQKLENILCATQSPLLLHIDLPAALTPSNWIAQAHISRSGNEQYSAGDLITIQSYPVLKETQQLALQLVTI